MFNEKAILQAEEEMIALVTAALCQLLAKNAQNTARSQIFVVQADISTIEHNKLFIRQSSITHKTHKQKMRYKMYSLRM